MEEEHPDRIMFASIQSEEMDQSIDTGSKWAIEPSTTLRDELIDMFRDIGLSFGRLHITEGPICACFCNKFETENSIFSKEHILFKDVHILNSLFTETGSKGKIAMEVLFQRSTLDRLISVRGEGTRKDRDVTKGGFKGFIEDIGDFVFKVLSCDERIEEFPSALA